MAFDPAKHLHYVQPEERLTMEDLGLTNSAAPSRIGVTAPFPLVTAEGVEAIRRDILKPDVINNYMMPSAISGPHIQLRGMAPEAAKFLYDLWMSPEVLSAVSEAAGEELVPVFDYEIGHTNIQVPEGMARNEYARTLSSDPYDKSAPSLKAPKDADKPAAVVGYHRDAYPWVCVLMLSDVTGMVGGETEIRRGDGTYIRALGPNVGYCVMMQGGFIEHCALPCHGARERITMVTSFRPKNKVYVDASNLATIRTCSNSFEMYDQFVRSRLDIVEEMMTAYRRQLQMRRETIEDAYGRRGGLKRPTVDIGELNGFVNMIKETLGNAVEQTLPYGTDPKDIYTPRIEETSFHEISRM